MVKSLEIEFGAITDDNVEQVSWKKWETNEQRKKVLWNPIEIIKSSLS